MRHNFKQLYITERAFFRGNFWSQTNATKAATFLCLVLIYSNGTDIMVTVAGYRPNINPIESTAGTAVSLVHNYSKSNSTLMLEDRPFLVKTTSLFCSNLI